MALGHRGAELIAGDVVHPARPRNGTGESMLSAREIEVAALIAAGHTNRQIADRLVISKRTVDAHVQRILRRLGCHSRSEIAAWAERHHLLA